MGYYPIQILDRPAGTLGYEQGIGEQMAGVAGGLGTELSKSVKDAAFRKALGNSQYEPEFSVDKEGNVSVKYSPKKTDVKDMQFKLQMALGGFSPMSSVLGKDFMEKGAPMTEDISEGGKVGTPPGATAKDGYYYNDQGDIIGSYDESAGPMKKDVGIYDNVVRKALGEQVQGNEFARELVGLPKPEKSAEEKAQEKVDLENAVNNIRGKKVSSGERKMIEGIRKAKGTNQSLEDITKWIELKGYEPDDFADELKGYVGPQKKSGPFNWLFNKPSAASAGVPGAEKIM